MITYNTACSLHNTTEQSSHYRKQIAHLYCSGRYNRKKLSFAQRKDRIKQKKDAFKKKLEVLGGGVKGAAKAEQMDTDE